MILSYIMNMANITFNLEKFTDMSTCDQSTIFLNVCPFTPPHLQIQGRPRMARASVSRQSIDGPCTVDLSRSYVVDICCCITV